MLAEFCGTRLEKSKELTDRSESYNGVLLRPDIAIAPEEYSKVRYIPSGFLG